MPKKPPAGKFKDLEPDICPVCGGQGFYIFEQSRIVCHACHGATRIKTLDYTAVKKKRKKVEIDHSSSRNK